VLLPDSFTSRGSGPICAIRNSERSIKVETRRDDLIAALAWLRSQPGVDARRIALLGWSHGAMTTLSAIDATRSSYAKDIAGAAVFYPGCAEQLRKGMALKTPLLMQLGASDDWTPPLRCEQLVAQLKAAEPAADITLKIYPDSYHAFDSKGPVRFRADVPNGVNAGGVHVGGNRKARAQSLDELDRFLKRILQ
jgi:dienelactone hydrolase